ncbi:hypothetical protein [Vreelandella azerica]|uniref:hypothetical protein n=1 Tax=Vreelandella azerica TaxID=2732867 RepID=UPI002E280183|nr:hypothetical protein [Halomonas azerica]
MAGLKADGKLNEGARALTITASGNLTATGNNLATGDMLLKGGNIDLSNSQSSAETANITAKGALNTSNANLVTQSDVTLNAQSLKNAKGKVYAGNDANLVIGTMDSSGVIAAADNLDINAASIDSSGTLAAGLKTDGSLNESGNLNVSTTGKLTATDNNLAVGDLVMKGSSVDVSGSQTSADRITLKADSPAGPMVPLDTSDANIVAQESLTITADRALDNTNGVLASQAGNLKIDANGVINAGGLMVAAEELGVEAHDRNIINTGGSMLAEGDITLLTKADIYNEQGLIQSNAGVSLSAVTLGNRQTSGDDQGVVGNNADITATKVDNTEGQILAGNNLAITAVDSAIVETSIINDSGILNAQRALTLKDSASTAAKRNLEISNNGGEIVANHDIYPEAASVTIAAKSLDLSGTLESGGNMSLDLVGDLATADGEKMSTEGVLSLHLQGGVNNTFTNAGSWEGGTGLVIKADEIINQQSGKLRSGGTTTLNTQQASKGSITNRGLINGNDTRISSHTVENVGSGRIYGDHIAIEADTLTNREIDEDGTMQSATIAARERLDIGAAHITNQEGSVLLSNGDMAIGGKLSNYRAVVDGSENATTLNNNSATIESLGDMTLAADTLRNTNEHFETKEEYLGTTEMTFIKVLGKDVVIDDDELIFRPAMGWNTKVDEGQLYWVQDEVPVPAPEHPDPSLNWAGYYTYHNGSGAEAIYSWDQYLVERKEYTTKVSSSDPGLIRTGGNLTL